MFMGQYNHSVDAKGRLIMPVKFREQLGEEFVVTKGLDQCLYVYSNEEWKKIEDNFRERPMTGKDQRKFARFFFAGAVTCETDKQGRILVPSILREFAGIEKDVVLAGVMNRIEIWSAERWSDYAGEYDEEEMDEVAEKMAELGFGI
ncbi:MAG: division/cell wall cluster transcriptional repressor MraZ [Eubacterium sp.]|nr:division/cell wall cluster transcriptional repressor MraZ [Eubacterium sp.]